MKPVARAIVASIVILAGVAVSGTALAHSSVHFGFGFGFPATGTAHQPPITLPLPILTITRTRTPHTAIRLRLLLMSSRPRHQPPRRSRRGNGGTTVPMRKPTIRT
jgi:hypothetical protein